MSRSQFKIGTRASTLALAQTKMIQKDLSRHFPDAEFKLLEIRTEGDKSQEPFNRVGTKGIFTRAIDECLTSGEIDFAVHSLKDLPTELSGVVLAGVPLREDPRDALITKEGVRSLKELKPHSRIGTSSPRRAAQILAVRSDLSIIGLRGNLGTRIRKLEEGIFDAIVVALAGLVRIGRVDARVAPLEYREMLPCPGQGALAITVRTGDVRAKEMAGCLQDAPSRLAADAERSFLKALGGSCELPCGAWAEVKDAHTELCGVLLSADGKQRYEAKVTASNSEVGILGEKLKSELYKLGAQRVLLDAKRGN